jgi:outer membrane protein OmpA-like peptidoglycan-associated protein
MTGLMFLFLLISLVYMVAADIRGAKPVNVLRRYVAGRAQIYSDLRSGLAPDLQRWHASLDPTTLSINFSGNTGLFARGSSELQPQFEIALGEFFPRYVAILAKHKIDIREVRVEGFTSTAWPDGGDSTGKYLKNMALSQERARAVLRYVLGFRSLETQQAWLKQVLSADGFSYSHLVRGKAGAEDAAASDRVEFHVLTGASAKIEEALKVAPSMAPGSKATPTPPPPTVIAQPLPAYPSWSRNLVGKRLANVFPKNDVKCYGYLDGLVAQYVGKPSGVAVSGWAFDLNAWQPVKRVLLVDPHGVIQGAADGGFSRPDVQNGLKWITSPDTGWHGYAAATSGPVTPWAVMRASRTACRLNVAPVLSHEKM